MFLYVLVGFAPWVGTTDPTDCGDFSSGQINIFVEFQSSIAHAMPRIGC